MRRVTALWRHPIKGHGREALDHVTLTEGQTMPWDRRWAVAHEAAQTDGSTWSACANFSRGAKVLALNAITARSDEAAGMVTLSHPERPDLTFDPDGDAAVFLDWVRPLMPENRAQSARIIRVPGRGMTDTDFASVSLLNMASNADLEARMGQTLSPLRWRGNIHFNGDAPWEELEWVGRTLTLGTARIEVRERIERCRATTADPATGRADADTLGALNSQLGHQDFGIYGVVTGSGRVALGDAIGIA